MFHHFPNGEKGEIGYDGLVRSTDFRDNDQQDPQSQLIGNPVATKLTSITHAGYKWDSTSQSYLKKSFPPQFTYSEAQIDPTVRTVDAQSLENLPAGADGSNYRWLDLDGEGLSGILTEQAGAIFYKRNLSAGNQVADNGNTITEPRFAPIQGARVRARASPRQRKTSIHGSRR